MKRNYMLSVVFLVSTQLATTAFGGECTNYSCQQSTIQSIIISRSGNIEIALADQLSSLKCSATGQHVQLPKQENPNFREQFTALLSSQKTKQPIDLTFNHTARNCVIENITVKN
ncbi:hypothetical protein [Spartinivicinus ruber]|uniref:hypothetical protein n=1 Tax=Spartinivicinus ruber TaxID=2683272 RepID=UPI0013D2B923|nr:hypothetical protein [Spartinivicinus ruber]